MRPHRLDPTSLIAGFLFVGLGLVFLSDQAGTIDLEVRWIWPALLIGLGIALLGPRRASDDEVDGPGEG